jgi:1,4-dihydroxy-2-naphthoate polyprenyltransferase
MRHRTRRTATSPPDLAILFIAARTLVMNVSAWIVAARPRTLSLSMTPVFVGAAVAWAAERKFQFSAVSAALVASAFIQLGTNLHNDAADSERGGDGPDRIGPLRATASGLLDASIVKCGAATSFGLAAAMGLYLVYIGGWPILLLGVLSIAAGWSYTGGPFPIAYTPFGELFVLVFFGLVAVCGTYLLCTGHVASPAAAAGFAVGSLTAAVLLVNNQRDAVADARVGRRTLAIVAGPRITVGIFGVLLLLPFALLPLIGQALPQGHVWPAVIPAPAALWLIYSFVHDGRSPFLNRRLVQTVLIQLLFSVLLSVGLLM